MATSRGRLLILALLGAVVVAALVPVGAAAAPPPETRLTYAAGEFVPIPDSVPHEEGDMVDRRIVPDLRWIAERYPIYITDGFSGHLPDGEHVGCSGCHVEHSDHLNGLAVDIVPLNGDGHCDSHLARDHPARPLGRAAPELPAASVPLGRLRRRRRPRLRQPPPPLLDARARRPVRARRMGRNLPGQLPGSRAAAAAAPPHTAGRDLDRPLRRPLTARRLSPPAAAGP